MAEAGHRHETEQNNGVAHFLEHMMFKVIEHISTAICAVSTIYT